MNPITTICVDMVRHGLVRSVGGGGRRHGRDCV